MSPRGLRIVGPSMSGKLPLLLHVPAVPLLNLRERDQKADTSTVMDQVYVFKSIHPRVTNTYLTLGETKSAEEVNMFEDSHLISISLHLNENGF